MRTTRSKFQTAVATILQAEEGFHQPFRDGDERQKISVLNGLKLESSGRIRKQRIFSEGDFPEGKSGIFNPAAVSTEDGFLSIFRCEPFSATWAGYWIDNKGIPCLAAGKIVDGSVECETPRPISSGMPMASRPEDWRLFRHQGEIFVNFTNYFYFNSGFPQRKVMSRTALGRLDGDRIQFIREMDASRYIKQTNEEKNWVFFSQDSKLYCIYSMEPFVLLICSDDGEVIEKRQIDLDLPRFGSRYIANSCNPILVDLPELGSVWLMCVHQFYTPHGRGTRNRTYFQHLIAICPERLQPVAWSPFPIVGGGLNCSGRHDGVIYISGLIEQDGWIHAFAGEGDAHSVVFSSNIEDLENWLDVL